MDTILKSLNENWYGSFKLHANYARFERQKERKPTRTVRVTQPIEKPITISLAESAPLKLRDKQTYAKVLEESLNYDQRFVCAISLDDTKKWLNRSLVGDISKGVNYVTLAKDLTNYGLSFFKLGFLEASRAILTFDGIRSMRYSLDYMKSILSFFF